MMDYFQYVGLLGMLAAVAFIIRGGLESIAHEMRVSRRLKS